MFAVMSRPTIQNIIATASLTCPINLRELAASTPNTTYNPAVFAACILRSRISRCTTLIFASGKIVCTGTKSETELACALRSVLSVLPETDIFESEIQNIVSTAQVPWTLNLLSILNCHHHREFCSFDPEIFPGLVYKLQNPTVTLLIFANGKLVITGAKSTTDVHFAYNIMYPILRGFALITNE
jgi:transcription initiation factor TFIID TATA-box-binding protein